MSVDTIYDYLFTASSATPTITGIVDPVTLAPSTPSIAEYIFGSQGGGGVTGWGDITGETGRINVSGQPIGSVIGSGVHIDVDEDILPTPQQTDIGKFLKVTASGVNTYEAITSGGFTDTFVIADWVNLSNVYYTLTFIHNLGTLYPQVELLNGSYQVRVDQVEIVDANSVKIYVIYSPDGRFNGSISILK